MIWPLSKNAENWNLWNQVCFISSQNTGTSYFLSRFLQFCIKKYHGFIDVMFIPYIHTLCLWKSCLTLVFFTRNGVLFFIFAWLLENHDFFLDCNCINLQVFEQINHPFVMGFLMHYEIKSSYVTYDLRIIVNATTLFENYYCVGFITQLKECIVFVLRCIHLLISLHHVQVNLINLCKRTEWSLSSGQLCKLIN